MGNIEKEEFLQRILRTIYKEMKKISQENNCTPLFIWHCWLINGRLERHEEYKPEAPYLDLCNIYSLKKGSPDVFFADFCHPSLRGHKIIAEEIAKRTLEGLNDRSNYD